MFNKTYNHNPVAMSNLYAPFMFSHKGDQENVEKVAETKLGLFSCNTTTRKSLSIYDLYYKLYGN